VLIRQIESRIIIELISGENDFKKIAIHLGIEYATLISLVRRLESYHILQRNAHGVYEMTTKELTIAPDKEVNYYRRNNPNRHLEIENPLPQVSGDELDDLKEFVKIQCEENVPRSKILKRLKKYGYMLSRLELLQFVEYYHLAPKRKNNKESEVEVA